MVWKVERVEQKRTYSSTLWYMVRNFSPIPSTSRTRIEFVQSEMQVPTALRVSDCSSTTARSPTLPSQDRHNQFRLYQSMCKLPTNSLEDFICHNPGCVVGNHTCEEPEHRQALRCHRPQSQSFPQCAGTYLGPPHCYPSSLTGQALSVGQKHLDNRRYRSNAGTITP